MTPRCREAGAGPRSTASRRAGEPRAQARSGLGAAEMLRRVRGAAARALGFSLRLRLTVGHLDLSRTSCGNRNNADLPPGFPTRLTVAQF